MSEANVSNNGTSYDAIIIGAGHNGLVCAAYLARKGRRVLVLEAGESPGGMAARRDFAPAFTASVCNLRPESRGHVRIVGADYRTPPEIRPAS